MTKPYWTQRLAVPEDTPAILQLVRAVHGEAYQEINETYWRWRYLNDTPFRADIIMAEHEGQPIGIQPMAIFEWQQGTERMKGAMYTGVLTHPAHRRRGVFRSLVEASNEHAKSRGARFSMTLPNDASLPGFLKTKEWHYPGLIDLYLKVIDGPAMLRPRIGRPAAALVGWAPPLLFRPDSGEIAELQCRLVQHAPDEMDEIADAFARDCQSLMILRTAAYWQWRYLSRPSSAYRTIVGERAGQVCGAVATSIGRRAGIDVGMIMDVTARGGVPVIRALLRSAQAELKSRGIGLISCQGTSPLMREALVAEGYRRAGPVITRKKFHFVFRPTGCDGWAVAPDAMRHWHLTFGDSDNA